MRKSLGNILFVADPLAKLKLAADTTISFAEAALELGFAAYWCAAEDIIFSHCEIVVSHCEKLHEVSTNHYRSTSQIAPLPLSFFQHAFVRKDPPFDDIYRDLCWLLATQTQTQIHNPADKLVTFHEKALQWRAFAEGVISEQNLVPTCLSSRLEDIKTFCAECLNDFGPQIVVKPWMGHGGESIHLCASTDDVLDYVTATFQKNTKEKLMVQPFLKNIHTDGDRRVLIANGTVVGDFVRVPATGHIESNLAQGGSAEMRDMTQPQKGLMNRLAKFLTQQKISFAGVDLIGERIGEINITSPTGVRTVEKLTGQKIASLIIKNMLLCFLGILLTHCQTSPYKNYKTLSQADNWQKPFDSWKKKCFAADSGGFIASVSSQRSPELFFEGQWSSQWNTFEGRVANPLNQTLLRLVLDASKKSDLIFSPEIASLDENSKEQLIQITNLLDHFGPVNLRKLFCGVIGFSEPDTKSYAHQTEVQNFGFQSRLTIEHHKIDIKSFYRLNQWNTTVANLDFIASEAVSTPELKIQWHGSPETSHPESIKFELPSSSTTLKFEEFD